MREPRSGRSWWIPLVLFSVAHSRAADCNGNGLDDAMDIVGGSSADCNQDGIPDECPRPVLEMSAPGRFPAGNWPVGVVTGDFDRDGDIDLATANSLSEDVTVLRGRGDGSLAFVRSIPVRGRLQSLAVADFDADRILDLAVTAASDGVAILRGGEGAVFTEISRLSPGLSPVGILAEDLNEDSIPDLVTSDSREASIQVLLGNGDLSFQGPRPFAVGLQPAGLALGDLNNDDDVDLIVANAFSGLSILLGRGNGDFVAGLTLPTANFGSSVVALDLNEDGNLDLASHNTAVSVFLGVGDGTFGPEGKIEGFSEPRFLVAADFSGDARPDLAVSDGQTETVSILVGEGDGTFQAARSFAAGPRPLTLAPADLDRDGVSDVVATDLESRDVWVLRASGGGDLRAALRLPARGEAITAGDFDKDGRLDLATVDSNSGTGFVILGQEKTGFAAPRELDLPIQPMSVAAADLNADGASDLAVVRRNDAARTNELVVLISRGDGTFEDARPAGQGVDRPFLSAGDFNGDGVLDLAVTGELGSSILVFPGTGGGAFGSSIETGMDLGPGRSVAIDVNLDGLLDIVTPKQVLLGKGDGSFEVLPYFEPANGGGVTVGDFDGDGRLDLAATGDDKVRTYLGNGDGTFEFKQSVDVLREPLSLVSVDLDADGSLDLAVACAEAGQVFLLKGRGDGTFTKERPLAAGLQPFGLVTGDLNGDGRPDLATVNAGDRQKDVSVFFNSSHLGLGPDCNANGILDECDISQKSSPDANENTVPDECEGGRQLPGDCNQDGSLNVSDGICLFAVLFLGRPELLPCGSGERAEESNLALLDWSPSRTINISDGVAMLNFLFFGGPPHPLAVPGAEVTACIPITGCPDGRHCSR